MASPAINSGYDSVFNAMDKFEMSNVYKVRKGISAVVANVAEITGEEVPANTAEFEEVEVCGGGLYLDFFSIAGIESLTDIIPPPCASQERRRATETKGNAKAKLVREQFQRMLEKSSIHSL